MKRPFKLERVWDVLAVLAIGFAIWKIFIAPRALDAKYSYPAPPTGYARLDGSRFEVQSARGRMLVLDFYASWCEPCKASLPLVESWARANPRVQVVPVDVGEPPAVVEAYAKKMNLSGVTFDPNNTATPMFGLDGFPTLVVIDPQNRVRAKWTGLNPAVGLALDNAQRTFST